jgi:uncharacterized protein
LPTYLTDSGPLVALLDRSDAAHEWARRQFSGINYPVLTCEGAIAETSHLLAASGIPARAAAELVSRKVVMIDFQLEANIDRVITLMNKYHDTPMDFVDACMVVMAEAKRDCQLITIDSDFHIYRRFERQMIPLIMPAQ